jgi:hypothetical protein
MKAGAFLDSVGLLGEGDALVGDFLFEFLDGRDVPVDDRLAGARPLFDRALAINEKELGPPSRSIWGKIPR